MKVFAGIAEQYADFAAYAEGDSPCFADWARRAAADDDVLAWLDTLPVPKRQPNLVFAAARWHGVPAPAPYDVLRAALLDDDGSIARTVRERSTQTNEAGRLATLLPALARVAEQSPEPLALLELGASAGLCLYPDRYAYRWQPPGGDGEDVVLREDPDAPELVCRVLEGPGGRPDLPRRLPVVAWRGGIDLHPLDVADDEQTAWLTTLVWPEQEHRRARLVAAIGVARADPPVLVAGDLLEELPAAVDLAARHGTVVVLHSAAAAYLDPAERERLVTTLSGMVADGACRWISNEGAGVLPGVTATGPDVPEGTATFVLGLDGRALAWTHGHGASMTWL
ncbi:hypothetical protein GCM10009737_04970 [Nocardioides lentus]|uniref:DUF2332 domain-containing protein n=1 Tax=Nocardioides lentus TaxID=338077 RepID=A0ABN2NZ85_9ACTN